MTAPSQVDQARELANEVYRAIGARRRLIKDAGATEGAHMAAWTVRHDYDSEQLGSARVGPLLRSIYRFGPYKTARLLETAHGASEDTRLRDLSRRQREAIAAQLELWAAGYGR